MVILFYLFDVLSIYLWEFEYIFCVYIYDVGVYFWILHIYWYIEFSLYLLFYYYMTCLFCVGYCNMNVHTLSTCCRSYFLFFTNKKGG